MPETPELIHTSVSSAVRAVANGASALYRGRCETLMPSLRAGSIDLVVTSPPYFMGKDYDRSLSTDDFVRSQRKVLSLAKDALRDGGSICWQVGFHVQDQIVEPLDFLIHGIVKELGGLTLRNRIVWHFGHGVHAKRRFSGRHEVVLWYTKGDSYSFDLDAVRVPQKYPGKKHYKGTNKGNYSGNPLGKNPSDVWEIPNVNANHIEKQPEHQCQFPVALCERLVLALTKPGDTVLDPYAGVGSCGVAALHHGRRFIGAELEWEYARVAAQRLERAANKQEPFRPHDLAVLEPKAAGKVAVAPAHFGKGIEIGETAP